MMKVLVCGDRNWTDGQAIERELLKLCRQTLVSRVIHGAARGADTLAGRAAKNLYIPQIPFPAQWDKYGRAAGPIRNQQMLDDGRPDLVLAFHENIKASKGTKDMVRRAKKAGIEVRVFSQ